MTDFSGKKAVVLGGTSGIGFETVRLLAEMGATVAVGSRRGAIAENLPGVSVEQVDVLDRAGLQEFFTRVGKIDYLVNAATGGPRATGPFMDMDLDGFKNSFAKLWGYTHSVHIGGRFVNPDGAIVLVSGAVARRCKPGYIAISTVGNAVEGFVRGMARELTPIRINAVAPGLIDTPMFAQQGQERTEFLSRATANNPIPRVGQPDEIAQAIAFVLANRFMTGTTVDVDGGAVLA